MKNFSKKTKIAISKYTYEFCVFAAKECDIIGNGANTISYEFPNPDLHGKTRCADAAINAGREILSLS
jgi:hypothetical protein